MKMREFPDWMNPVLVKELRQSLHDRSIAVAAGVVIAVELLVYYIEQVNGSGRWRSGGEITTTCVFFYWILGLTACGLLAYTVWRNGRERGREGFDPAHGTGFSPVRIALGHILSMLCHLLIVLAAGLPCILWSMEFPEVRDPEIWSTVFTALLACGAGMQFAVTAQNGKKSLPLWAVLLIVWLISGPKYAIFLKVSQGIGLFPFCIGLLLAAVTAVCGEITFLMPQNADRAKPVKCAFFVLTTYIAVWAGYKTASWSSVLIASGLVLMFASMLERFAPSRRQVAEAPANPVLRGLSLLTGTGVLPGFAAAMLLMAAGAAVQLYQSGDNDGLSALLVTIFYMQTALFFAHRFHQPPVWMWFFIMILCNIPLIGGFVMPWGTALSLGSDAFLDQDAALLTAGIAGVIGIVLNLGLYRDFFRQYFKGKPLK